MHKTCRLIYDHVGREEGIVYRVISLEYTRARYGLSEGMQNNYKNSRYIFTREGKIEGDRLRALSYECLEWSSYAVEDIEPVDKNIYSILVELSAQTDKEYAEYMRQMEKKKIELDELFQKDVKFDYNSPFLSPQIKGRPCLSFITKGVFTENKQFLQYYEYAGKDVCKILKSDNDNEDILVYIPIDWLKVAGYDLDFVKKWIEQLQILFDSEIEYMDIMSYAHFKPYGDPDAIYITNNKFIVYKIDGNEHYMVRYLLFNFMRYLYHYRYNNIPGLTMKIWKECPEFTFFKCLLLAHYSNESGTEYGIGKLLHNDISYQYPNPNTDFKSYLNACIKGRTISYSIPRKIIHFETLDKIKSLFEKGDYARINLLAEQAEDYKPEDDGFKAPNKKIRSGAILYEQLKQPQFKNLLSREEYDQIFGKKPLESSPPENTAVGTHTNKAWDTYLNSVKQKAEEKIKEQVEKAKIKHNPFKLKK